MMIYKRFRKTVLALLIPFFGFAFPPGTPMSEFGPSQISVGAFFDHSGQDLFLEEYPSVLNTTGLSLEYAPWSFIQMGLFGGAGELDVAFPASKTKDSSFGAFNSDYKGMGGLSGKVATPRFGSGTTRLVAYGSASFLQSSDAFGNSKNPFIFSSGAALQFIFRNKLNLILGGEYYAWTGEQKSSRGAVEVFGISQPNGSQDLIRGLVGIEYFFKGLNRPFLSIAFRPTPKIGWDDHLGLRNASISISLGAMTTLGKARVQAEEEDASLLDE